MSAQVILSETEEQQEMRNFPGPLSRWCTHCRRSYRHLNVFIYLRHMSDILWVYALSHYLNQREDLHKVDALEFAQQRAGACAKDVTLHDRSSAALLWNLLILLCRQNGVISLFIVWGNNNNFNPATNKSAVRIQLSSCYFPLLFQQVVGSDIAELLMQDSHSNEGEGADGPTLIDFSEPATVVAPPAEGDDLLTGDLSSFSCESPEKALQSYTDLLLAGRKKVHYSEFSLVIWTFSCILHLLIHLVQIFPQAFHKL